MELLAVKDKKAYLKSNGITYNRPVKVIKNTVKDVVKISFNGKTWIIDTKSMLILPFNRENKEFLLNRYAISPCIDDFLEKEIHNFNKRNKTLDLKFTDKEINFIFRTLYKKRMRSSQEYLIDILEQTNIKYTRDRSLELKFSDSEIKVISEILDKTGLCKKVCK